MARRERIMWIERKTDNGGLVGPARIGLVTTSKSGRSLYYGGRMFQSLDGLGWKANYYDVESGEEYWISGCRRDGMDALYSTTVEVDEDVREEYWTSVRARPDLSHMESFRAPGKY